MSSKYASLLVLFAMPLLAVIEPGIEKIELFAGGEKDHKLYRIPGIVVTSRGSVLVYCEGRRRTGGDWDTIDIMLRRSTDGGKTFSPQEVIGHVDTSLQRSPVAIEKKQGRPDDVTYNNPVAIADKNGTIHFVFCIDYMRVFYMASRDDGKTFSKPVEITQAFASLRPGYAWRVVATGPGHGIQLTNGRLLVPAWVSLGKNGNGHGPSANTTLYSDDHGKTWHVQGLAIPDSTEFPSSNETEAVQLTDGSVMLSVRTPSAENRRVITTGKDGAGNWAVPHYQADLPDPHCMAGLVRLSTVKKGGRNRILFSNPDNLTRADGRDVPGKDRKNVTVRISYDEGASWTVKRTVEAGPSGYSDLAVLPDGTILCFYEASRNGSTGNAAERLLLARFSLDWLTEGKDTLTKKGRK